MSEEDSRAEEVAEEEETPQDEVAEEEGSGTEPEEAAPEPPKKRAKKAAAAPKAKDSGKKASGGKKKKKAVKKHPKTMDMVIEAIDNLGERKGSSVQAIKAYILQNFKTVRPDMIKSMLRRALATGAAQGILTRPKGQAETQTMAGRYLLGKGATKGDDDEVMPQQSRRAQEAMKSKAKGKKKGKKGKKVAKKPVARTVSSAKRPAKKTKGRK